MIRRFPVRLSTLLVVSMFAALAAAAPLAASGAEDEEPIDNPAVLAYLSGLPAPKPVSLPWRPGRFAQFQAGSAEEDHRTARGGRLSGRLYQAPQPGPAPYAVLLAGCGNTYQGANALWFKLWARALQDLGMGALALDSFGPRGVHEVCGDGSKAWAQRRVDDAYSALAWLADQPFADAERIALIGMSNGARTALLSIGAGETWRFRRFAAAVAFYPTCDRMPPHGLLAPALLLLGQADDLALQPVCEAYLRQRPAATPPRLVAYPGAFHLFDVFPRDDDYAAPEVLAARDEVGGFLRRALGLTSTAGSRTATPAP